MPKAVWNGVVVAESNRCEVVEGNQYFPPDEAPLVIRPEKLLEAAALTVKVAAAPLSVTVPVLTPPSARPPTVCAKPPRSNVPVPLTVNVVPEGSALLTPSLSVPVLMVVAPL